ncbi:hypothetical protein TI39_contig371g00011 [Zymoseptoria brevis]|uniref:NACHT-NTPase and P-loop NTPases N-terminal domain-containing protein n=1 Tax=Zymoseptoria brevis TaxID=1047168 RepID=A0A0F4GSI8_9PEZI|nr:hypothetical protein TI39_contig371g00011 [Zymoseptoria brevis]
MAEAIAVLGLIGAIINITEAIKETYKIAAAAHKLPEAFVVVNDRIPVVQKTLAVIQTAYRGAEDETAIRQSLNTCKENAEDLRYIFEQTLQAFHIFKNLFLMEDLVAAIEEIGAVDPSIPETASTTICSSGTGALFNTGSGHMGVKQQNGDGNYQAETIYFQAPSAAATIETFVPLKDVGLADACKAVTTYIDRFGANKDLLLMRDDHKFMQPPYPRTILTTFESTFRQLKGENTQNRPKWELPAMKLLRLFILDQRLLSGESSVEYCDTRQNTSWDDDGYCTTLGLLHRHGLVRPKSTGLPGMLPMHKIVRWRVQKESESHVRAYLSQYAVLLELALSSRSQDELGIVRLLNELADTYRNIGKLQYAEPCARLHTERQCDMRVRHHAETVKSLERLIAILGQQGEESMMKYEMFVFLKDAADRAAVLATLPGHLLMLPNSAFRLEESHSWPPRLAVKESDHRHASYNYSARALTTTLNNPRQRNDKPGSSYSNYPGTIPIDSLGAWVPQESLSQHASKDQRLQDEVLSQIMRRKAVLREAASTKPDLVTLFEVFSTGSRDLIALYMHHIDADVVHYRDPVDRRTVLHFVAAYGEPADVRKCIQSGAELLAKDRFGETPLEIAHVSQRRDVFRTLEAAGGVDEVDRAEQGPLVSAGRIVPAPAVEHVTNRNAPSRAVERQMFNTTSHQAYMESDEESSGEYQGFYSAPLSRTGIPGSPPACITPDLRKLVEGTDGSNERNPPTSSGRPRGSERLFKVIFTFGKSNSYT